MVALALGGASGCLLYTEPINASPTVTIVAPATIYRGTVARFAAEVADPDQAAEEVEVEWSVVEAPCDGAASADRDGARIKRGRVLEITRETRDPFCVRAVARDRHGAEGRDARTAVAGNRPPTATLAASDPGGRDGAHLLFHPVRLAATGASDPDGDPLVEVRFEVRDPAGAPVELGPCAPGEDDPKVRCFTPRMPGAYRVRLTVSDGTESSVAADSVVRVAEDQAPCIDSTVPDLATPIVSQTLDEVRRFEVRRVVDDGHPYPAGPLGMASFHWFTLRPGEPGWRRVIGHDRATLDVGARLLDGIVQPGTSLGIRVEVRDPERERPEALRELDVVCRDREVCEQPTRCVRWTSWTVRFR